MTIITHSKGRQIKIQDHYRISLSHKYQLAKVVSITKSNVVNQSLFKLNTWMTNKEKLDYPFNQIKSADQVYMNKTAFIRIMNFFYSGESEKTIDLDNIVYRFTKHFDIPDFPHVTIQQIIKDPNHKEIDHPNHSYRGIVLDIKEYQNLLSRAN